MTTYKGLVDGITKHIQVENLGDMDIFNSHIELVLKRGHAHVNSEISSVSKFVLNTDSAFAEVLVLEEGQMVILLKEVQVNPTSTHGIMGE